MAGWVSCEECIPCEPECWWPALAVVACKTEVPYSTFFARKHGRVGSGTGAMLTRSVAVVWVIGANISICGKNALWMDATLRRNLLWFSADVVSPAILLLLSSAMDDVHRRGTSPPFWVK